MDYFKEIKALKEKKQNTTKKRKSTIEKENAVQAYAKRKVCIITAKLDKAENGKPLFCYDLQLAHFAKMDALAEIYGAKKAQEIAKKHKAYFERNTQEKKQNQSGKSTALDKDFMEIFAKWEKENAENMETQTKIVFAHDIIAKQKAKFDAKLKEWEKAQKETEKAEK